MRRIARVTLLVLATAAQAMAATIELETVPLAGGSVMSVMGASGGKAVRFGLDEAKSGAVATIPLPAGTPPGKYLATLRVQFFPAEVYSDAFTLGSGEVTRTFMATDCPDPAGSDWRLWTLPVVVEGPEAKLVLGLERSGAYQEPTTRAVVLDSLSLLSRGAGAYIAAVRPDKVMYGPGEEVSAQVFLCNVGAAAVDRKLRVVEVRDLGVAREVGQQTVNLPANSGKIAEFKWKLGPEEYGREVRAELLEGQGAVVDREAAYFHVADNVWKVAMRGASGPHMTHPDSVYCGIKTPEQWQDYLAKYPERLRARYGNFVEWFAWAPDDAFFMTPTAPTWVSGQGCYQHDRQRVLDLMKVLKGQGVWPITYAKSAASGPPSYEFMRKHPEWGLGRYQVQYDQQFVRDWDKQIPGQDKTIFYTWMSLVMNITIPAIVDAGIKEILDSAEMFGWRGARYDDHYTYWGKPYDEMSTRNMQRIFELGKQRNPGFVWGLNYITMGTGCVWPGKPLAEVAWKQQPAEAGLVADPAPPRFEKMPEPYPELKVACENGGYIMNEEARGAHGGTYSEYARLLTHEARLVRGLGGHYGPIPFDPQAQSAFNNIYPDILRAASRSHTYGDIRGGTSFLQFLTRYSGLVYGTALTPLTDPEAVLSVTAQPGVWWHMFAYSLKEAGRDRVVVHLLSAPQQDTIADNKSGMARKITNAAVTYKGTAAVAKAWELSPFMEGYAGPLTPQGKTVRPGDFFLWKIVVLELKKGGAQ